MTSKNCLNCGKELTDKFCSGCGQKSDTHRISFKHFISHDLIHGTFHIEKGMLFTAKQALIRPGKAALNYIEGKRINYYNVFYFILLLIGLNILLTHYYNEIALKIDPERALIPEMNEAGRKIDQIFSKYGKMIIFAFIPLASLNSLLIFKRKKLNYSEHFIINGFFLLGILIITTVVIVVSFAEFTGIPTTIFDAIHNSIPIVILLYIVFGYYNAFRADYSMFGFSYRLLLFSVFCFLEILFLFLILLGFATDWKNGTEIEYMF